MCRGEFPVRGSSNVTIHLGLGSLERSDDFEFWVFDRLMQRAFRRAFRTIDASGFLETDFVYDDFNT